MAQPTDKELYDYLAAQVGREDELYLKRTNFLVVLNVALAAAAGSQFHYGWISAGSLMVAGFAILLTLSFKSVVFEGKKQIHYLTTAYFKRSAEAGFPRPFWNTPGAGLEQGQPRRFGRIVREFLGGWAVFALCCVLILAHYLLIGRL